MAAAQTGWRTFEADAAQTNRYAYSVIGERKGYSIRGTPNMERAGTGQRWGVKQFTLSARSAD
jgi:hypothetical protein